MLRSCRWRYLTFGYPFIPFYFLICISSSLLFWIGAGCGKERSALVDECVAPRAGYSAHGVAAMVWPSL